MRTPAEVRDLMSYSDAYDPLADELEAFAQFIRHSTTAACRLALRSPWRSPHVMTSFFPFGVA
jgi:hypothetical protein